MTKEDDRLYNLEFGVEVSTLYHEWRRSALEFMSTLIRATTLAGSVVALIAVYAFNDTFLHVVAWASVLVAVVSLIDLVFHIDAKARLHTDLYRCFKRLQVEIAKGRSKWPDHIDEWAAEAQRIRVDEPPVLWAIYMDGWNQALQKRRVDQSKFRRVTAAQRLLGHFCSFKPLDFPLVGADS